MIACVAGGIFLRVCVRQSREKISKRLLLFSAWPRSSSAKILIALTIPPATQTNEVRGSLIALPLSWCYTQFLFAVYREKCALCLFIVAFFEIDNVWWNRFQNNKIQSCCYISSQPWNWKPSNCAQSDGRRDYRW